MQNNRRLGGMLTIVGLIVAPVAQAHHLVHEGVGLLAGFTHPLLGWDHMLAILAVGLWAARQQGPSVWHLPGLFLGVMLVGAGAGQAGLPLPLVEAGIASSLLVLGLLLAMTVRLPTVFSMFLIGLFAVFHGFAHGVEMPPAASPTLYGLGFIVAATGLLALGVWLGGLSRNTLSNRLIRAGGIALGVTGVWMWA